MTGGFWSRRWARLNRCLAAEDKGIESLLVVPPLPTLPPSLRHSDQNEIPVRIHFYFFFKNDPPNLFLQSYFAALQASLLLLMNLLPNNKLWVEQTNEAFIFLVQDLYARIRLRGEVHTRSKSLFCLLSHSFRWRGSPLGLFSADKTRKQPDWTISMKRPNAELGASLEMT